jgi:hypothetical protein
MILVQIGVLDIERAYCGGGIIVLTIRMFWKTVTIQLMKPRTPEREYFSGIGLFLGNFVQTNQSSPSLF